MYKVYWIKSQEQYDPFKEGYIGITSQPLNKRFNDHKHNSKNKHLRNRCRKQDVEIVCLFEDLEPYEAKRIELAMRPDENIGWNINKGGDLPPSRKGKVGVKVKLVGDERTEKQKLAAQKHSERMKGNNSSGKRKNKVVHEKFCENCQKHFIAKQQRTKYCCLKCAAIKREKLKHNE